MMLQVFDCVVHNHGIPNYLPIFSVSEISFICSPIFNFEISFLGFQGQKCLILKLHIVQLLKYKLPLYFDLLSFSLT